METDKLLEVLLTELRGLRAELHEMKKDLYSEINDTKKDISTLKTRFMLVAVTMGVAGSKISAILPFLK